MRTRKPKKRKPKAKIKLMVLAAAAVLLVVFALSPLSKYLVSLSVMSVYSGVHERQRHRTFNSGRRRDIGGGLVSVCDDLQSFRRKLLSVYRGSQSRIDDLIQFPCLRSASGQGLQPLIRSNIALLQCVLWCLSGDRHRGHIGNRRHFPDRYRGHIGSRTAGRHCCQRGCFAMRV